ncbi:hypothetical protein KY327_04200, partial [Candidatus Woesearchaeota archaeon]|nr:hypothetical protein [Candidatus Woesearchaeota archaeon]
MKRQKTETFKYALRHGRHMQSRAILLVLAVLVILGTSATVIQAGVDDGACITMAESEKTACYQRSVESADGFGAVELCGDCFACGYDDGVCPEDFTSDGVTANCTMCPDP